MATITSLGIGTNGLDSEAIVTKLVELEKKQLTTLQNKATLDKAQISAFATIKSGVAALGDAAKSISSATGWSSRVATSSNTAAATVTATDATVATSFTLDIDALAKGQSLSSSSMTLGAAVGAGTLTFRLGTWSGGAADASAANAAIAAADANVASTALAASTAVTNANNALNAFTSGSAEATAYEAARVANASSPSPANQQAEDDAYAALSGADLTALTASNNAAAASTAAAAAAAAAVVAAAAARPGFAPGAGTSDVSITVTASDTVTTLAAKINASSAGVVATVFKDGTGERLLLRSKDTGEASGFRVQATDADGNNTDNNGLSRLAYDPQTGAFGMASSGTPAQYAQNAKVRINGLEVTSASNILKDNIPGVTINLTATTTTGYGTGGEVRTPTTIAVREDVTAAVKKVQDFVTAYNTLAAALADMTKYDAATKTPSIFQGDAAVVGLQRVLRSMVSSISAGSSYQRLSEVGIEQQLNGTLSLNTTKLAAAANNGKELEKLFTTNNSNAQTNGFALKFAAFSEGVLASGGSVASKASGLQKQLDRNAQDQVRVNARADAVEKRLRAQYSALDGKMAGLNALNAYVAQQVATWNKSTS